MAAFVDWELERMMSENSRKLRQYFALQQRMRSYYTTLSNREQKLKQLKTERDKLRYKSGAENPPVATLNFPAVRGTGGGFEGSNMESRSTVI